MYSCYMHSLIVATTWQKHVIMKLSKLLALSLRCSSTYIQTVSLIKYNVSININIYYLGHPQQQCSGGAMQLKT